jgi:hypothetical protein
VAGRLSPGRLRVRALAIDDHCRLDYAEIHPDETATTCAGFLRRAAGWFAEHRIDRIERVMTDNAFVYRRSHAWRQALADLGTRQLFTGAYRPQTNGIAERFNRTLLEEWAYARPSSPAQSAPGWLAARLQPSPHPHRPRRTAPDQPPRRQRPPGTQQLPPEAGSASGSGRRPRAAATRTGPRDHGGLPGAGPQRRRHRGRRSGRAPATLSSARGSVETVLTHHGPAHISHA